DDRVRCLSNSLRKREEEATKRIISHLQSRDPTLFSDPDPPCTQPALPEAFSSKTVLFLGGVALERSQNERIYPVTKKSIGNRVALLITNIKFADEKLNRNGAEKDEENMEKLLGALGYEVVKHTNLTAKGIEDALIAFSTHPKLKDTDSVFVVIMSHGKLGAILGVNWKGDRCGDEAPDEFPINNIYRHLASEKCPALLDKPKVIIIQACRGGLGSVLVNDRADADVVCDDVPQPGPSLPAAEGGIEDDSVRCVHREKDFTALLSSTPGHKFYKCKVSSGCGTWSVMMPTKDRCTLIKRFYLFPGL
uniref:Caspase family p20 domain-containing protein n=1 Tax=Monopterus albus TaxID=43700 RepID=A0A3Q3QHL6_MONAL